MATEQEWFIHRTGWDVLITTRRFQHRLEVAMDQCLEAMGVSFAQYRALEVVAGSRPLHISGLARRLRLTRQATQATAEKLSVSGLVDLDNDGYRVIVVLTDLGERRLDLFRKVTKDVPDALDRTLSPIERYRLVSLLERADRAIVPPRSPTWWLDD